MSGALTGLAQLAFELAFQASPIFLTGGIAGSLGPLSAGASSIGVGGVLPILALTQAPSFLTGLLTGNVIANPNQYFATFQPVAGSTLIDNAIGEYPFANQSVAANAIIRQPLKISMEMICPASGNTPYVVKLATITLLQASLQQHVLTGGLFTVLTPSFVYSNCILKRLVDISTGDTAQRQFRYQWDFEQPLVTLQQAQTAQNTQMSKLSSGVMTDGSSSGANVTGTAPPSQNGGIGG